MKNRFVFIDFFFQNIFKKQIYCFLFFSTFLLQTNSVYSQKKVEIVKAGSLKFDKSLGDGAKRLIGDVEFKQENTLMFCDSAYFYSNNSLDAFGHVHIQQGDSIHLYGDILNYNGNTKKAIISKNVIVNKGDMQLTTDILNYDVATSIGFYTNSAHIVNKENVLTSTQGYYFAKTNDLNFKKNVILTNPQFVINSDTLRYNTRSKITYFLGPSTIKSKENLIYCEDGFYDTKKDFSRFSKNSYIQTKEQKMFGDSIYYDRKNAFGKALQNVTITDTVNNITINGDVAIHYENTDLSIVTGNTLLTQVIENDTLFLHADTLKAKGESKIKKQEEVKNKQEFIQRENDSTEQKQTNKKQFFAFHKVKFYKKDIQGKCDSLNYSTIDSTMKMFGTPTLWSSENQLTADTIDIVTGNKSLKYIELKNNAFIISQEDSLRFNQIRGKKMKGFFKENELNLVKVRGNGQTIYYVKEKEEIKAVNRADCSNLDIYLIQKKVDKITFITKPDATLYPLNQIDVKELRLKDFIWRNKQRPFNRKEIFYW